MNSSERGCLMNKDPIRVLLIEDEHQYVNLLRTMLSKEKDRTFEVNCARTLATGIERSRQDKFDVVVLDLGLPDSKGIDTVEAFRAAAPDLPIVVLSANDEKTIVFDSVQKGAQEYLVKDSAIMQVLPRSIRYAIERKRVEQSLNITLKKLKEFESIVQRSPVIVFVWRVEPGAWPVEFVSDNVKKVLGYTADDFMSGRVSWVGITHPDDVPRLEEDVAQHLQGGIKEFSQEYRLIAKSGDVLQMEDRNLVLADSSGRVTYIQSIVLDVTEQRHTQDELRQSLRRFEKILDGTVNALASTVELRDPYTAGHQRKVAQLALAIAQRLGFSGDQIKGIHVAAFLHDIGKIAVPAEILSKPGPLTELEFSIIKTHASVGHDVLGSVEFPWPVARIVLEHHERMDGSGYPGAISGKEIILEARILGVADVVEAMSSHRPYRAALGIDQALEEISKNRGVLYDHQVVDACMKLFKEEDFKFQQHGQTASSPSLAL